LHQGHVLKAYIFISPDFFPGTCCMAIITPPEQYTISI
jgi:hypothetical protein